MIKFADANNLNGLGWGVSLAEYETALRFAIKEAGHEFEQADFSQLMQANPMDASGVISTGFVKPISYNEDGSLEFYRNEQGDIVKVDKGYYTENMLNLYGREKVDSDGNVTASMTLGGTLRALADWLGFDGEFGIQGGFAKDNEGSDKEPVDAAKPVVLDMDGDGIEVSLDYQASFDYDGDGFRERTAWVSADDAFLVVDLNADGSFGAGDGKIDQRKELVLSDWGTAEEGTDMQALAEAVDANGDKLFDTNGDGKLTAADTSFSNFRVWQDLDQDGEVDAGEMRTLSEAGITQINLTYDNGLAYDDTSDDLIAGAASQAGTASFVMDGVTRVGGVGDMVLAYDTQGWKRVELTDAGGNVIGYSIELEGGANLNYGLAIDDADGMLGDASASSDAPTGLGLDDILNGGSGDDILTGGSGADIIELDFGSGSDTMTDFQDGLDIIDLSATGLSFADLTIADNGSGDVVISFDDGDAGTALDELTLTGITAAELTSADFQFG